MIYDKNSKNMTHRGQLTLKPQYRYELSHESAITLSDIKCQYLLKSHKAEEVCDAGDSDNTDTASEADSETILSLSRADIDQQLSAGEREGKHADDTAKMSETEDNVKTDGEEPAGFADFFVEESDDDFVITANKNESEQNGSPLEDDLTMPRDSFGDEKTLLLPDQEDKTQTLLLLDDTDKEDDEVDGNNGKSAVSVLDRFDDKGTGKTVSQTSVLDEFLGGGSVKKSVKLSGIPEMVGIGVPGSSIGYDDMTQAYAPTTDEGNEGDCDYAAQTLAYGMPSSPSEKPESPPKEEVAAQDENQENQQIEAVVMETKEESRIGDVSLECEPAMIPKRSQKSVHFAEDTEKESEESGSVADNGQTAIERTDSTGEVDTSKPTRSRGRSRGRGRGRGRGRKGRSSGRSSSQPDINNESESLSLASSSSQSASGPSHPTPSQRKSRGGRKRVVPPSFSDDEQDQKLSDESTPAKRRKVSTSGLIEDTADIPKIMFTGIRSKPSEKIVQNLGGQLVDSVFECSHLVTDKVMKTIKFLCVLARGKFIVSTKWLDACKKAGKFIDASSYILRDLASEREHSFQLKRSIEKASAHPLFQGLKIYVTPNVRPPPAAVKDVIECSGGEALTRMPVCADENTVVVSSEEDKHLCISAAQAGICIYTKQFLVDGVLKQELLIGQKLDVHK
eukprot:m.261543 g.261543  ORF g.261543 m.261543 type:complete len:678 (+) comp40447_c1_seq58:1507-3540(+)